MCPFDFRDLFPEIPRKIQKLAEIYLSQNPNNSYEGFRFDLIGILLKEKPEIKSITLIMKIISKKQI